MTEVQHARAAPADVLNEAGVRLVAEALLKHEFENNRTSLSTWGDYSNDTQDQFTLRAQQLMRLYDDAPAGEGVLRVAMALLRHDWEHNRASTAGWQDITDDTQEQYLLRGQQLTRLYESGASGLGVS